MSQDYKQCRDCGSLNINYWDETEEEIVLKCRDCKKFFIIPKIVGLKIYFNF